MANPARTLIVGSAGYASSAQSALAAVTTRRSLFGLMVWLMQPVYRMKADKDSLDFRRVETTAVRLRELASMIPDVYATDTHAFDVPTAALPDIWTQPNVLQAKAIGFMDAATVLERAAAAHNREATLDAIQGITVVCQECHAVFIRK